MGNVVYARSNHQSIKRGIILETLDLVYDHYKETFAILSEQIKQRNKKFVFIFLISCILLLFAFSPDEYGNLVFGYIYEQYSIDLSNQFAIIQTFLWVILLYETLRYSQAFVYIEREYKYIDTLESKISELSDTSFDRESKDYDDNFSMISKYTNIIYKYLFPLFSIVVAILKIISEWVHLNIWYFSLIDTFLCIAYLLLWIFHSYYAIKNDK